MQTVDDPRVGTVLAGYRIRALLGRGGTSVVYLAEDPRLKRSVALKLLAPALGEDASSRSRFLRESELAASIDHPHIVPIYEAGEAEDLLFIAMRYVEGRDLKRRLADGCLEPAVATGIVAQVASALDAAHARGLIHRDVKPSNVLLDSGGGADGTDHAYLADFGLTTRQSDGPWAQADGALLGTIDYVAPEQIAGDDVDGRADVYSLTCVLYECVAGHPPFRRASEVAAVFAQLHEEPPALSTWRPDLRALDASLAKGLAKRPEERYATCRELAQAALAATLDEATRAVGDIASRAAAGRSDLSELEEELADRVLQASERARALSHASTSPGQQPSSSPPFKGLSSFERDDAELFFGRERLVAELVARVAGASFLALVGPSGSGKSSVLHAGVLATLAEGVLPDSAHWPRRTLRPGDHPMEALRRTFALRAPDPVGEALDRLPSGSRLVVAIDQLEELFTACESEDERAAFVDALVRLASDPQARAIVLVALRGDYYGRFAAYPALADRLGSNHVLIGPMRGGRAASRDRAARRTRRPDPRARSSPRPSSTTSRASRARCRSCRPRSSSSGGRERTTPSPWPPIATRAACAAPSPASPKAPTRACRTSTSRSSARSCCASSPGATATPPCAGAPRWPSSIWTAIRTSPPSWPRSPTTDSCRSRTPASRSRTRRCCASGRACATGSRRTRRAAACAASSCWPRWSGSARAGTRRSSTAAPRLAATLDWAAAREPELNDLERDFVDASRDASQRETRRVRRTNRRLRSAPRRRRPPARRRSRRRGLRPRATRRRPRRRQPSRGRGGGGARPAPRRAGARRGGPRPLAAPGATGRGDRRHAADPGVPARRPPALAGGARDHARHRGLEPSGGRRQPRRQHAGRRRARHRARPIRRRKLRADRRAVPVGDETYSGLPFVDGVAYSPDGTMLAFGGADWNPHSIDTRTREMLARVADGGARMAFTPDGELLVHLDLGRVGGPATVVARDATTLEQVGPGIVPPGFLSRLRRHRTRARRRSRSHRTVARSSRPRRTGELAWWDLRTGEKRATCGSRPAPPLPRAQPGRASGRARHRQGHRAGRRADRRIRTAPGTLTDEPHWVAVQPRRQHDRVDEPGRLRDALGSRVRARRRRRCAATPTASSSPPSAPTGARSTPSAATERRSPGTSRAPRPREAVRVHARPRLRRDVRPASREGTARTGS